MRIVTEEDLEAWGEWAMTGGIGLGVRSIFSTSGGGISSADVERLDAMIARMGKSYPQHKSFLKRKYLSGKRCDDGRYQPRTTSELSRIERESIESVEQRLRAALCCLARYDCKT